MKNAIPVRQNAIPRSQNAKVLVTPRSVRIPKWAFPTRFPSVYGQRLFLLIAFNSKFIESVELPLVELGRMIGVRDRKHLYDVNWWKQYEKQDLFLAPMRAVVNEEFSLFPLVSFFHVVPKNKTATLKINPDAREFLQNLDLGFTQVHFEEALLLDTPKATGMYVFLASLEHLIASAERTFSFEFLCQEFELRDKDPSQNLRRMKRIIKVVEKRTPLRVEIEVLKDGRSIRALRFKVRRQYARPKPYLKLSKRGL